MALGLVESCVDGWIDYGVVLSSRGLVDVVFESALYVSFCLAMDHERTSKVSVLASLGVYGQVVISGRPLARKRPLVLLSSPPTDAGWTRNGFVIILRVSHLHRVVYRRVVKGV